jgi:hypothetical protein
MYQARTLSAPPKYFWDVRACKRIESNGDSFAPYIWGLTGRNKHVNKQSVGYYCNTGCCRMNVLAILQVVVVVAAVETTMTTMGVMAITISMVVSCLANRNAHS